jgi:hypothetical protein
VARYIKELNPNIAVGLNTHGISRGNYTLSGIDRIDIYDDTGVDAWEGELWVQPELTADGVLINPIREYKAARNLGVAFTSVGGTPLGRAMDRAFSYRLEIPGVGWLGGPRIETRLGYFAGQPKGDDSYKYVDYYRNTEEVADVAVLRSYPSTAYNTDATWRSTIGFEQALIQAKVPFTIVFEKDLADLSEYKVLVLANAEMMADGELEHIRKFVRGGGGLVATGSASIYNQWRRPRPNFGLGDVLGLTPADAARTLSAYRVSDAMATWVGVEGIQTVYNQYGKGKTVYIPRVVPASPGPQVTMELPRNWSELIEAVKVAADEDFSVEMQAPLTVVMNLYRKPSAKQMLLHLVNFKQDVLTDIPMSLKLSSGERVKSVTVISTDRAGEEKIKFEQSVGRLRFRLPKLEIYDMVVVQIS